jgi:hypothetical protein
MKAVAMRGFSLLVAIAMVLQTGAVLVYAADAVDAQADTAVAEPSTMNAESEDPAVGTPVADASKVLEPSPEASDIPVPAPEQPAAEDSSAEDPAAGDPPATPAQTEPNFDFAPVFLAKSGNVEDAFPPRDLEPPLPLYNSGADLTYTVTGGEAQITGYVGAGGAVVIPSTLGGYPVTSIGKNAFSAKSRITSFSLPDSLRSIGDEAFSICTGITRITIPKNVTSIGVQAFDYCIELKNVVLPPGLTSIPNWAFMRCYKLESISLPQGITKIGRGAFNRCTNLASLNIPQSVTEIDDTAFLFCESLTNISIPKHVTRTGFDAFSGCTSLKTLTFYSPTTTIYSCDSLAAGLKIIGFNPSTAKDYAARYNKTFESFTMHNSIEYATVFDFDDYVARYPGVATAYGADNYSGILSHFVNYGIPAGLQGRDDFNPYFYRNNYYGLWSSYGSDISGYYYHFIQYGDAAGLRGDINTLFQPVYDGVDYSPVFDIGYYSANSTDVSGYFGTDYYQIFMHFLNNGMTEGRRGNDMFYVSFYRGNYPGIAQAYGTDLRSYYYHYMQYGQSEGLRGDTDVYFKPVYENIDYTPVFDAAYYYENNDDLKRAYGMDKYRLFMHFLQHGMTEGRKSTDSFDVFYYRHNYPGLVAAYGDDLRSCYYHFMQYGQGAGFVADKYFPTYDGVDYSEVFEFDYYLKKYPAIASAYGDNYAGIMDHFVNYGMDLGLQGCAAFNPDYYRENYPDVAALLGDDLRAYYDHYIQSGQKDGLRGDTLLSFSLIYNGLDYSLVFDVDYYFAHNDDIKEHFQNDGYAAFMHFINHGMHEGRRANQNFCLPYYITNYPSLRTQFGTDYELFYKHFIQEGYSAGYVADDILPIYYGVDYSDVLDISYYAAALAAAGKYGGDVNNVPRHTALLDFVATGITNGYQGIADFNPFYYRNNYNSLWDDLGANIRKYYYHYMETGKASGMRGDINTLFIPVYKGIDFSLIFDIDYYFDHIEDTPDDAIRQNALNLLKKRSDYYGAFLYFLEYDMPNGIQASAEFNVYTYRSNYPGLVTAYGDDLRGCFYHYMQYGQPAGLKADAPL